MASAQEYAAWIVGNKDKQGTPEFETVASAYKIARGGAEQPQATPDATHDATASDRVKALQGGLYKGVAGIAGLPMDTVENVYNGGKALFGAAATYLGRPDLAPELTRGTPLGSESIAKAMNTVGINTENPRPDDTASRMLHTGGVVAGGSMVPGAGVKSTLAAAAGGAVAGETIGPQWAGLGSMVPAAGAQAVSGMKNAIAAKTAPIVDTFKQAGAMPSVGQATDNVFMHGLENLAAKFPGGSGVMQKFIENQQRSLGARARTGVSTEDAGRAIEKGVTGEGGFLDRFHATQNVLYDRLDKYIPKDTRIVVNRTQNALADLNSDIPGAPNISKFFKNSKIQGIEGALKADTETVSGVLHQTTANPIANTMMGELTPVQRTALGAEFMDNKLPYEAVKKLRTLVGREITDATIASSVPKSKWKALYAALSDDLGGAAKQVGPDAERAWGMANSYTRAGMTRIESVLDRVIGKGSQPEDIFKRFNPTDPDQANKVRSVLRSLAPAERQIVSEAVVNRLGRATPGKQNEFGELFSSETFLTNWNKLSPGAKAQLFPDPPLRDNVNKIAAAAASIRTGRGIYANPSGTAGSFAAYSIYLSPMTALGYIAGGTPGAAGVLASAGASAAGANIGAKMMTSPKVVNALASGNYLPLLGPKMITDSRVVKWLATPINISKPNEAQVHLMRLGVIFNNSKDEALRDEISKFVSSATGADQSTSVTNIPK